MDLLSAIPPLRIGNNEKAPTGILMKDSLIYSENHYEVLNFQFHSGLKILSFGTA